MDNTLFDLLNTGAPSGTLVIRLLAAKVFFAEGIKLDAGLAFGIFK